MAKTENEEKKKFLWSYRDSMQRAKRIEAEIDEIRDIKMSASASRGGAGCKGWKNDLSGYASRIDNLDRILKEEQCDIPRIFCNVREAIERLEDKREKDVLFYRYIKGLRCWEIGEKMGRSERWVLKVHGNALEHLKIFEKN